MFIATTAWHGVCCADGDFSSTHVRPDSGRQLVRLQVIGSCVAIIDDVRIEPSAEIVFAALLVLCANRGRPQSRLEIARLLWPDADAPTRSIRLRWLLHRLRQLGVDFVATRTDVVVPKHGAMLDSDRVGELRTDAIGPVLPGYSPRFSGEFARWLDRWRDEITCGVTRHLVDKLVVARAAGRWVAAEGLADALIRVDPLNEEATLQFAEIQCQVGSKALALATLDRYLAALGPDQSELRLTPELLRRRITRLEACEVGDGGSRFVGRHEQLARIDTLVASTCDSQGGAIVFTGPPGIGKTRLLGEAAARANWTQSRGRRMRVIRVGCVSSEAGGATLAEVLQCALDLPGAAGIAPEHFVIVNEYVHAVNSALDAAGGAPLVPGILDLLDATSSETPLLFVLDDADKFAASARKIWPQLLAWSESHPVAWLIALRNEQMPEHVGPPSCSVGALDLDSAEALLTDLTKHTAFPIDEAAREALLDHAAGHPLLLQALLRDTHFPDSVTKLPAALAAHVERALDRLSLPALTILRIAGILRTEATLERIERCASLSSDEFIKAVGILEAEGMLTTDQAGLARGHLLWSNAALRRLSPHLVRVIQFQAERALSTLEHDVIPLGAPALVPFRARDALAGTLPSPQSCR
jgi:DNA-binding SARP family transcriptional activator